MPILIPAHNPGPYTGDGNNTWLFTEGDAPTLVDAGTGVPAHLDAVAAALGGRPLHRVIVTHGHSDHASGVPAVRERWPAVEVLKFVLEDEHGWIPMVEGMRLTAGDRELRVIHTPGHAPDHVCLWDASRGELFAGDMVVRPGSVLIPAGRGGSLREYLASLRRMALLGPTRIYPGHGPVIDRPLEVIEEYIEHRRIRENQVLECLADGVTDVDAIVGRLYVGLREGLERAARMTVLAHLDKLREEGRFT